MKCVFLNDKMEKLMNKLSIFTLSLCAFVFAGSSFAKTYTCPSSEDVKKGNYGNDFEAIDNFKHVDTLFFAGARIFYNKDHKLGLQLPMTCFYYNPKINYRYGLISTDQQSKVEKPDNHWKLNAGYFDCGKPVASHPTDGDTVDPSTCAVATSE